MPTYQHAKLGLPRIWLMTDERLGGDLAAIVRRLPRGSGVIFRHYSLNPGARRKVFAALRRVCRQRGHCLLLSGDRATAMRWHADGVHDRQRKVKGQTGFLVSMPVHNAAEIGQANQTGADIQLLSPLHATTSHAGERPLGPMQFGRLAHMSRSKVVALGGMNRARAQMLGRRRTHGWAAISAFSRK